MYFSDHRPWKWTAKKIVTIHLIFSVRAGTLYLFIFYLNVPRLPVSFVSSYFIFIK